MDGSAGFAKQLELEVSGWVRDHSKETVDDVLADASALATTKVSPITVDSRIKSAKELLAGFIHKRLANSETIEETKAIALRQLVAQMNVGGLNANALMHLVKELHTLTTDDMTIAGGGTPSKPNVNNVFNTINFAGQEREVREGNPFKFTEQLLQAAMTITGEAQVVNDEPESDK